MPKARLGRQLRDLSTRLLAVRTSLLFWRRKQSACLYDRHHFAQVVQGKVLLRGQIQKHFIGMSIVNSSPVQIASISRTLLSTGMR